MFGRRNAARARQETEVGALLRRARSASRVGNHGAAAQAQEDAAGIARDLAGDPRGDAALGGVLRDLGDILGAAGRPEEAVVALDEAEDAYGRLPADRWPVADLVADVQARRGTAYGLAGAGGSALVDVQSAVVRYRATTGTDPDDPRQRDLAGVLAANADVLAAYGDPDLAVGSADLAVRIYLHQAADINSSADAGAHVGRLRRALAVAVAVHGADGRPDLAEQAATIERRMGGPARPVPTVLAERQRSAHPPALTVTVASALAAARFRFGAEPPRVNFRAVVRPAVDLELVVPLDRALRAVGPGQNAADAAARLGGSLARTAGQLLATDPVAGVRLGLEAHALLAGASRLESPALRHQLPALGPPWAGVLLDCSRRAEATGDPALAMDLAAWAGGVAEQMFPATLVDREARTVAVAVLDHHGRLLAERGEEDRARDAARAAARLRGTS